MKKSSLLTYELNNVNPDDKKQFIQKIFNSIVPTYNLLNHLLSFGIDKVWRRAALRKINNLKSKRVLDICCGTGDISFLLKQKGAKAVSVDFSRQMVLWGIRNNFISNLSSVADAACLPYKDNSFEAAIISFGIRNIPDLHYFLKEVRRVLTPSGRFVILELVRPKHPLIKLFYRIYLNGFLPLIGKLVSGNKNAYRYLAGTITTFINPSELLQLLKSYGFSNIIVETHTLGIAAVINCVNGEGY